MTYEEFNTMTDAILENCKDVLRLKAGEYANEKDRLCQFKQIAPLINETPEQVLIGMWLKHVQSICEYVNVLSKGKSISIEKWDEKIIDSINYMVLLRGLLVEKESIKYTLGE
ncbi:MAG: hypothetical protein ABFC98_05755 [Candidatus Cloacimonas sp.]